MRVAIIVLNSLSGNTKLAASLISRGFSSVSVHSVIWRGLPGENDDDSRAINSISESDAVGVGTPTMCWKAPRLALEWILRRLPREAVSRKPCFVFTTFGTHPGACLQDLALAMREMGAHVIGSHSAFAPDSFAWFSPRKGEERLKWTLESAESCVRFGQKIAGDLSLGTPSESLPRLGIIGKLLSTFPEHVPRILLGPVSIDSGACVGCGECVASCPTRSIVQGTESPHWTKCRCIGCARCIAICRVSAISAPAVSSESLSLHNVPPEDFCAISSIEDCNPTISRSFIAGRPASRTQAISMVSRFIRIGILKRTFASLHGTLVALVSLFVALPFLIVPSGRR